MDTTILRGMLRKLLRTTFQVSRAILIAFVLFIAIIFYQFSGPYNYLSVFKYRGVEHGDIYRNCASEEKLLEVPQELAEGMIELDYRVFADQDDIRGMWGVNRFARIRRSDSPKYGTQCTPHTYSASGWIVDVEENDPNYAPKIVKTDPFWAEKFTVVAVFQEICVKHCIGKSNYYEYIIRDQSGETWEVSSFTISRLGMLITKSGERKKIDEQKYFPTEKNMWD